MEADWEFEVGGDAPKIDALWPGFIDLRKNPESASSFDEAIQLPALGAALQKLNAPTSPLWTSKCDHWVVRETEYLDADELNATPNDTSHAVSCYIDLLPRLEGAWSQPESAAAQCRKFCSRLASVPARCCRADLVIRRALITEKSYHLGVTAYITACGAGPEEATRNLAEALGIFAHALGNESTLQ